MIGFDQALPLRGPAPLCTRIQVEEPRVDKGVDSGVMLSRDQRLGFRKAWQPRPQLLGQHFRLIPVHPGDDPAILGIRWQYPGDVQETVIDPVWRNRGKAIVERPKITHQAGGFPTLRHQIIDAATLICGLRSRRRDSSVAVGCAGLRSAWQRQQAPGQEEAQNERLLTGIHGQLSEFQVATLVGVRVGGLARARFQQEGSPRPQRSQAAF